MPITGPGPAAVQIRAGQLQLGEQRAVRTTRALACAAALAVPDRRRNRSRVTPRGYRRGASLGDGARRHVHFALTAVVVPFPLRSEDCEFTEPPARSRPSWAGCCSPCPCSPSVHDRTGLHDQTRTARHRSGSPCPKLVFFQCPRLKIRCRS
jgi:hypothetical protein